MRSIKGKKVLIFSDGELKPFNGIKRLIQDSDFTICADGGIKNAQKLKVKPDLIMGDFDSSDIEALLIKYGRDKIKIYPVDKDKSDTEIAVSYAHERGAKVITILGALGKRMDHSLANIFTLSSFCENVTIEDEYSELTVYDKSFTIKGEKGQTVSLFPVVNNVKIDSSKGLKYPLNQLILKTGSHGLSNEFSARMARVNFKRGKILVIRTKQI